MLNRFCSFTSIKTYVEAALDIGISLRYRIGKIICSKEEQLYDGFCWVDKANFESFLIKCNKTRGWIQKISVVDVQCYSLSVEHIYQKLSFLKRYIEKRQMKTAILMRSTYIRHLLIKIIQFSKNCLNIFTVSEKHVNTDHCCLN